MLATERHRTFRCYRQDAAREAVRVRAKARTANAGNSGGHERARAQLTGAAGGHTSSTRRVCYCWPADIDLAPAFVRHSHAISWTACDDTRRLHGPRAHAGRLSDAIESGSR